METTRTINLLACLAAASHDSELSEDLQLCGTMTFKVTAQGQQHVVRPGVQTSTSTPSPITRLLARIEDWPLRVSKKVAHRIDAAVRLEDNNAVMPPAVGGCAALFLQATINLTPLLGQVQARQTTIDVGGRNRRNSPSLKGDSGSLNKFIQDLPDCRAPVALLEENVNSKSGRWDLTQLATLLDLHEVIAQSLTMEESSAFEKTRIVLGPTCQMWKSTVHTLRLEATPLPAEGTTSKRCDAPSITAAPADNQVCTSKRSKSSVGTWKCRLQPARVSEGCSYELTAGVVVALLQDDPWSFIIQE
ncbi:hypothetical protein NA56DRAFT_698421 [Hyaloscypha hepaticicola]|uniref:Uncharacterized protein n=1 Tax=Hyaloscypha hepaticicola TaxID=2082293 RepID=A0A2J6QJ19_9HELO|nr:hypothetical protein NA56DRAFT_698421 [Hyaloscypha hepaticicola]